MDEAARFYSGALRTSAEVLTLMCGLLDEATVAEVAAALENGFRIVTVCDPTSLLVMLLDQRSGQLGPLLASVNARSGREIIYRLENGESQPCRVRA